MSIVLVTGTEEYLVHKFIQKIKSVIENPDMNLSIFNEYDDVKVVEACDQLPFMSEKRVVICYGDIFAKANLLLKYCDNPAMSTDLYLVTDKMDKRKKLYKKIEKKGKILLFNKLKPNEYIEFLKNYFNENNVSLSDNVIHYLAEKTMYNVIDDYYLYDVISELDKLINYSGESNIDINMINHIIKSPIDNNIFRLINHITNHKKDAINQVSQLLLNNGVEVMQVLGLLLRHYRILYKYLVSDGKGLGLASFQLNEFKNSSLTKEDALLAIHLISICQSDIKSGKIDAKLGLEILLVKLLCKEDIK